ncbi:TetR family transcriptional regulator [Pseudomonas aeruginosa VRFPA01]|nr:TetR family transcriptional regulator [Pseudomonas aeruginosa VRFPA01]
MPRVAPRDSAAQAASAVAESVRYQGRKASHRAVAAEAQVPLSATTYYFKDIDDLITDTFTLFVERNAEALSAFWRSVEGDLQEMAAVLAGDPGARGSLVEQIVELAVQYVQVQLTERREHLLAEQAFRQEVLLNPRLRELADAHQRILSLGAVHFFQVLGSSEPEQDAKVLTSIILQMEYQGLVDGVEQLAVDEMRAILRRYLNLVMGL